MCLYFVQNMSELIQSFSSVMFQQKTSFQTNYSAPDEKYSYYFWQ